MTLQPRGIIPALATFPAVIKEALALLGIEAGPCLRPVGPMADEQRRTLRGILVNMGLVEP